MLFRQIAQTLHRLALSNTPVFQYACSRWADLAHVERFPHVPRSYSQEPCQAGASLGRPARVRYPAQDEGW